jgi:hypothetical protein
MRLASEVEETMDTLSTEEPSYKYTDLSDEAKEAVKYWWYEHGAEHEWWECAYEDFKRDGYKLGFVIDDINFSGFYSQGDGACWSGQVDVATWLKTHTEDSIARDAWCALIQEDFCDKHFGILTRGHYSHSNTMMCVGWDWVDESGEDDHLYLKQPTIFQGMHYQDVRNLITSSDFIYTDPNDIQEAAFESAKDYADQLYKRLREEYEYITGEENLIEMCEINDWKFNDEGRMV